MLSASLATVQFCISNKQIIFHYFAVAFIVHFWAGITGKNIRFPVHLIGRKIADKTIKRSLKKMVEL
jgi:hypothetical protein